MFMRWAAAGMLVVALAGCAPKPEKSPYNTTLALSEVMAHVIDPAAQAYWSTSGSVIDEKGERDLRPTTDAGWLVAENGAAGVIEGANLMMLPERRRDGEWMAYARRVSDLGVAALAAADARDSTKMFEVGAQLSEACDACHERYIPETP
jgi:hypothetical protein